MRLPVLRRLALNYGDGRMMPRAVLAHVSKDGGGDLRRLFLRRLHVRPRLFRHITPGCGSRRPVPIWSDRTAEVGAIS